MVELLAIERSVRSWARELGNDSHLSDVLKRVGDEALLIRFLHRYTTFNGNFAGCVASLAGAFHVKQDVFRDRSENITNCSDRSAEIASHIFFAAEDEYADRRTKRRVTHRQLAQELLKASLCFFRLTAGDFDRDFRLGNSARQACSSVINGYGVGTAGTEKDLFSGLGFHMGAEILADQEFQRLDTLLRRSFPELVRHLVSTRVLDEHTCYDWVDIHTQVEDEHFCHAATAAELAITYYSGPTSKADLCAHLADGFHSFARLQRCFFGGILEEEQGEPCQCA